MPIINFNEKVNIPILMIQQLQVPKIFYPDIVNIDIAYQLYAYHDHTHFISAPVLENIASQKLIKKIIKYES